MVTFEARATRAVIQSSRHMISFLSLHRPHDSAYSKWYNDKYYNSRLCECTALSTSSELKLAVYILDNVELRHLLLINNTLMMESLESYRLI